MTNTRRPHPHTELLAAMEDHLAHNRIPDRVDLVGTVKAPDTPNTPEPPAEFDRAAG